MPEGSSSWWQPTRLPLVWLSLVGDLTGSLVEGNVYRYEDHVLEPNGAHRACPGTQPSVGPSPRACRFTHAACTASHPPASRALPLAPHHMPLAVIQYRRVGMWTPFDAPARGSPGKAGVSSVSIDLQLSRARAERPGLIQVLVFHSA